ncbi:P-loop containing nucleoside triphosphate hydrolase protein [Xylaria scruposa]|nr:P-loop containing nucleoside triphosphate hydrolase protein [Xylaria scruposa]
MDFSWEVRKIKKRCPDSSTLEIQRELRKNMRYEDAADRVVKSLNGTVPPAINNASDRWDPLPRISGLIRSCFSAELELENIIQETQQGSSPDIIESRLAYYHSLDDENLRERINADVKEYPAIFYIVEADNTDLVRYWIKYGGDPNATCGTERFPLLAFAILHGKSTRTNQQRTAMVELLLTLGASPYVIPHVFYTPFNKRLPASGSVIEESTDITDERQKWCVPRVEKELVSALNLTQRYRLSQASKSESISRRVRTVLSRNRAERVLGLPYTVVGQYHAVKALRRRLTAQLSLASNKPLVFMFAGPSGHGKTEIARSLGELISTDIKTIDCTTFKEEMQLFGPRPPFQGFQSGSPLNNFLAANSGRCSIVFMDEFEKTTKDIHNTLLVPFDRGEYLDRRDSARIDCSRTIWILATNKFDDYILKFSELHQEELFESQNEQKETKLLDELNVELKKMCTSDFGAPLSGRVSEIIPFLPFTPEEQAVISHKGLMSLEETLRRPVVISPSGESDNLVGNIRLDIVDDCALCSAIAQESYTPQLGARCILNAVTSTISTPLVSQYLEVDEDLCDGQPEIQFKVGITAEKKVEVWRM